MAPGDERDLIQAVVTCEGNLHDPDFSERFQSLVSKLKSVLYTTNKKQSFQVRKIEPWNSVRVTISIPKDAAQRLRFLAQQGSTVLRQLGILSVQVEGDQVISLTLTGRFNEPQEVLLRQSNSGSGSGNENGDSLASAASTSSRSPSSSSTSCSSLSSASSSSSSGSSNTAGVGGGGASVETILVSSSPQQSSSGPSGAMVSLDLLSSSSSSAFLSPNVVAPTGESIPLPPKITAAGSRPTLGGPFPFASMTHAAAHTLQRNESVVNVVAQALFSSATTNSTNVSTTPSPVSRALGPAPASFQQSKSSLATSSSSSASSATTTATTTLTPMTAPPPSLSARKTASVSTVNSSNVSKTQQQPVLVTSMMMKSNNINNNNNIPSGGNNNSATNNNSQNSFGGPSPSSTNSVVVVMNSTTTSNYKMAQQVHPNDVKLSPSQVQHHSRTAPAGGAVLKGGTSLTSAAGHQRQMTGATSGKPRQFLINPLTGHLEPMPSESSSGSDSEGDGGGGGGRGHQGRVRSRGKESPTKPAGTKPLKISLDGLKINRLPAGLSSSKRSREEDGSTAKEINNSVVGVHVNNTDGIKLDKIKKLRLKLEKPESPSAALYKMDVTYVKKSGTATSVVSSSGASSSAVPISSTGSSSSSTSTTTPTTTTTFSSSSVNSCSSSGTGSQSSSTPSSSSSSPATSEVPRVPPLHISLRGKNAAVVVSPRRDESKGSGGGADPSAFNNPNHPHSGLSSQSDTKLLVNSSSSSSSNSNNPSKSNTLTSIALKRTKIRLKSSESANHEGGGVVVKKKLLLSSHRPTSQQQQQEEAMDPLKVRLEDQLKSRLEDPLKTRLEDPLKSRLEDPLKTRLKPSTTTTEVNKLNSTFADLTKSVATELSQLKSADLSQLNKSPPGLTQLKSADLTTTTTQLNKSASVPDLISGSSTSSSPGAKIIITPPPASSLLINPALVNPPPVGAVTGSGISSPPVCGVSAVGVGPVPTSGIGAVPVPLSGVGPPPAASTAPMNPTPIPGASTATAAAAAKLKRHRRKSELLTSTSSQLTSTASSQQSHEEVAPPKSNSTVEASQLMMLLSGRHNVRKSCEELVLESVPCPKPEVFSAADAAAAVASTKLPAPSSLSCDIPPPPPPGDEVTKGPLATCDKPESSPPPGAPSSLLLEPGKVDENVGYSLVEEPAAPWIKSPCDIPTACTTVEEEGKIERAESIPEKSYCSSEKINNATATDNNVTDKLKMIGGPGLLPAYLSSSSSSEKSEQVVVAASQVTTTTTDPVVNCTFSQATSQLAPSLSAPTAADFKSAISPQQLVVVSQSLLTTSSSSSAAPPVPTKSESEPPDVVPGSSSSILNQMLSEVQFERKSNNSQVMAPTSALEKAMEVETVESSLLSSASPTGTQAVQSSNALPPGTSEETVQRTTVVSKKGQVVSSSADLVSTPADLVNVHHLKNVFESYVVKTTKTEEDNNLSQPLKVQKVERISGEEEEIEEESVLAPNNNTCAPVMAAPLLTCPDTTTTTAPSRTTTTSTSLCSPSTMNSLTVNKSSDDHIIGIPGEDSGIDSMDALSEKSPNQGESPARKSESEQHFCDSSASHQHHSCQPNNPPGGKASQSSGVLDKVDLPLGQDPPTVDSARESSKPVPRNLEPLSSSQQPLCGDSEQLSSNQDAIPLLENPLLEKKSKSSSSEENERLEKPLVLLSSSTSSSTSAEEKSSDGLVVVEKVVVASPSERNQVPLSSSSSPPPSSHTTPDQSSASDDPSTLDLKVLSNDLEDQLTSDDELRRREKSGIKSDNNNGGPVDISPPPTTISSVPLLQGSSSSSAVQESETFSRSSGQRTDETLATQMSQPSQVPTKDIEPGHLTKVQCDLSNVQDHLTKVSDDLNMVPVHLTKVSENLNKVPDDQKNVSEELSNVPEDLSKVPQDLKKVPDDLNKVSQDLKEVPGDLIKVPGEVNKVPDDLSSSLPQPQDDSSENIQNSGPEIVKPLADDVKAKEPSGMEKEKSEPQPQVNHAENILKEPLRGKEERPSEPCAMSQVSQEKIASSLLAPVQPAVLTPNVSSATEISLPTAPPKVTGQVSQSVNVPMKSSPATVDVVTKLESPTTVVKSTSEEKVEIAVVAVKEKLVEPAVQEEQVASDPAVKVEQLKEDPQVPSSVVDTQINNAPITVDHSDKNDLDPTPVATPAPPSVPRTIQMKKLVSASPKASSSAGKPGTVPVPAGAGTKSEEVEEKLEVNVTKVDVAMTKVDAAMIKVQTISKVDQTVSKVDPAMSKADPTMSKVDSTRGKLDGAMTLRSTNVATAIIHPTVTVGEEKLKVEAVERSHNDIKSDLPLKKDLPLKIDPPKSDLPLKSVPRTPVDSARKDISLPVLTPAPVAPIRSEQMRPVMPNITPLQRPKVMTSEQAGTTQVPPKVVSATSVAPPILIRPMQSVQATKSMQPNRPEISKVSPAELKPKALNLNMTTTTTRTVVPNVIQLAKAAGAAGSKVIPVSSSSSSTQCHSNAKGSPIAVSLAPLTNSSGLTSSAGAPTVFAIHPHQYHHQSAITVLPGGHKMVPIKLVTIPKQNQTQLPMGAHATRSSPTILETVNLVAATTSRASSPNSASMKPKVQAGNSGLNLSSASQLNLSSGGNILVPISVSSAGGVGSGGTSSPVKVLVSSATMKMQPNILQSVMVKGQIVMANQNQAHPTTIRVVRPLIQADLTTTKSTTETIVVPKPAEQQTTTTGQSSPVKETRDKIKGPMFGHVEGVEVLETEDGTDDDLFSFAPDIIHDEKDLADVLAGENSDSVTENGILDNLMSEQLSGGSSPAQDSLENCAGLRRTSSVNSSESDIDGDKLDSPIPAIRASSPLYTYSMRSGRNSHSTSESRSPSPHDHDVHGEDQEIIDCLARSSPAKNDNKSDQNNKSSKKVDSRSNADHTYGALQANSSQQQQQLEQLSIEIPDGDSSHLVSPAASATATTEESRKSTRSTRSNTRLVSPDITAFRSETPKLTKFTSKPDGVMLRNSPKPSPTGRVHSPTVQAASSGPSRASPVASTAIASGSGGTALTTGRNSPVVSSRTPIVGLAMKRKRQESDSSSASKDDNNGEDSGGKQDIDLNARPGKRRCSENAAELIKACIGVEDTPKRNSSLVKKVVEMQDSKLKESGGKNKKALMAVVVEENEEDSEETGNDILNRGRCGGRSSRGSSEDRSSSRSSSTNRNPSKPEDLKDAKVNRVINRVVSNKDGSNKAGKTTTTTTGSSSDSLNANSLKKEDKLVGGRRSNRNALTKEKSPLATKARANIRKDGPGLMEKQQAQQQQTISPSISPANGNPRRKTRSSVAGVSDSSITSLKRRRISKDAKS